MGLTVLLRVLLVLLCSLVGALHAQELQPLPTLSAHVTDTLGLLPEARREALEARLVALEKDKGAQVAVLIVATTKPEAVESYALRVAEAWRLGRKGVDDGILFLIARDDRRMRIEVGGPGRGVARCHRQAHHCRCGGAASAQWRFCRRHRGRR
jgi:uncharacterized protein